MKKYYYWLITRDEQGKPYLIFGSDRSEDEARQKGLEMLAGMDFVIKRYPTRDLATASSFYRGTRLERGEGLQGARQRIGHNRSLNRLRRRYGD